MGTQNNHPTGTIEFASAQHIGYGQQRQSLEDRCAVDRVTTAGGLNIVLAVVADGIGGVNAGEVAAQLAVDAIFAHVRSASGNDLQQILVESIQRAHVAILTAARNNVQLRSMGTTATVAAVMNSRLYIAHVGDSRAYLARSGKLSQLTLDHSWGNERVMAGLLTEQQMMAHARKDELARYLGMPGNVVPDKGFRTSVELNPQVSLLDPNGIAIEPGDVVVLCSDGLIKERKGMPGAHYAEPDELVNTIARNEAQDAANTLLALALGRQVDDNVTVIILEAPGGKKKSYEGGAKQGSRLVLPIMIALALVAVLVVVVLTFLTPPAPPTPAAQAVAAEQGTPSPRQALGTLTVMDSQGIVKMQDGTANMVDLAAGQVVEPGKGVKFWTESGKLGLKLAGGAEIYLDTNTAITIQELADSAKNRGETKLVIEKGKLLVQGGSFGIDSQNGLFKAVASESVMGVEHEAATGKFNVHCLEGTCILSGSKGSETITGGQFAGYEKGRMKGEPFMEYAGWMALGQNVVTPTFTPTPTPTNTPTMTPTVTNTVIFAPTATHTPERNKDGGGGGGGGGDNPHD